MSIFTFVVLVLSMSLHKCWPQRSLTVIIVGCDMESCVADIETWAYESQLHKWGFANYISRLHMVQLYN
jgi:hypothetical protein